MRSPDLSLVLPVRAVAAATDDQRLYDETAQRLARVCAHLEPDSFAALVQRIVERKLRWARQEVEEMLATRRPPAD